MSVHPVFSDLKNGLIVSCQADPGDPLRDPAIMAAMAKAARLGGAVGIRASGPEDIAAIRAALPKVPIIGIYKADIPGFQVRITPTVEYAELIARAGAGLIAVDATHRPHPGGVSAAELINQVYLRTGKPVLADVSNLDEGLEAARAGAHAVLTTLSGYTDSSPRLPGPDFGLIEALADRLSIPVIAEGPRATPDQAALALARGAWAVVVGSAITRPRWITEQFAAALRPFQQQEKP